MNNKVNDFFTMTSTDKFLISICHIVEDMYPKLSDVSAVINDGGKSNHIYSKFHDINFINSFGVDYLVQQPDYENPHSIPELNDFVLEHYGQRGLEYINTFGGFKENLQFGVKLGKQAYGLVVLENHGNNPYEFEEDLYIKIKHLQEYANSFFKYSNLDDEVSYIKDNVLSSFLYTLEYFDSYTGSHCNDVGYYSRLLASEFSLPTVEMQILDWASSLHDIGKVSLHRDVLNKTGRLTDEEFEEIKKHSVTGEKIVRETLKSDYLAMIIRQHHEKWDGSGYPDGLAGENILFLARVICVADAYHAMTSERPYHSKKTKEEALEELERFAGIQFDPDLVKIFVERMREIVEIPEKEKLI